MQIHSLAVADRGRVEVLEGHPAIRLVTAMLDVRGGPGVDEYDPRIEAEFLPDEQIAAALRADLAPVEVLDSLDSGVEPESKVCAILVELDAGGESLGLPAHSGDVHSLRVRLAVIADAKREALAAARTTLWRALAALTERVARNDWPSSS